MSIGEHVSDENAFRLYERFRSYVLVEDDVCAYFKREFLEARQWQVAVLSEELSSAEAERLTCVCSHYGYEKAWALDINRFEPRSFYSICLDATALSMLEETFLTPSYLLVENEQRFMLVSDSDYFWEIAGPASFLEDLFETSPEAVNQKFLKETENYRRSSSRIGQSLSRVAAEAMVKSMPTL